MWVLGRWATACLSGMLACPRDWGGQRYATCLCHVCTPSDVLTLCVLAMQHATQLACVTWACHAACTSDPDMSHGRREWCAHIVTQYWGGPAPPWKCWWSLARPMAPLLSLKHRRVKMSLEPIEVGVKERSGLQCARSNGEPARGIGLISLFLMPPLSKSGRI